MMRAIISAQITFPSLIGDPSLLRTSTHHFPGAVRPDLAVRRCRVRHFLVCTSFPEGVDVLMGFDRGMFERFRRAVVVFMLAGCVAVAGCSPEGTGSAPKLKGNKDEIQKALQSGGAKPDKGAKRRKD